MALLDNLTFNPLLYGGQDGNILDMIRSFQQTNDAYKPGAGFSLGGPQSPAPQPDDGSILPPNSQPTAGQNTIQVGDYSMPRIGFGSPLDANAQMPAQQPAVPAPASAPAMPSTEPSFGDRLLAGFQSFANSKALLPALANGAVGLATGQRADKTGLTLQANNLTARALLAKGVDPQTIQAAVANPELMKQLIATHFGNTAMTTDQRNFDAASKDPRFAAFLKSSKEQGTKFGLNPVYGTGPDGRTVLGVPGNDGSFKQLELPEGFTPQSGVEKIDMGTSWQLRDKKDGRIVGVVPKDLTGQEAAKAKGKIQGQVQAALPGDIATADQTVAQIDQLLGNKGLPEIIGPLDQFRPSWTMSDSGRDALARYNQLKGKAFLQAYSTLRGGGQITEVEGTKAENAMARMDRAQSEEDFKAALSDFRDAVKTGLQKLKEKAGVAAPQGTTAGGVSWSVE
jgi:flagellar protein FlgJ